MSRDDLKNLIVGPVAPVPTPFDDNFAVDLGKMSDLVQWWIECGAVAGKCVIKIAAQAGEGEKLRESEWPALLRTAVQASNGKASIMVVLAVLESHETGNPVNIPAMPLP